MNRSKTETLELAELWANNPVFDQNSRREIQELIDNNNEAEIFERFYKDLEFGTGGMRAILGMGPNRMNAYSIRRGTQAIATVLKSSGQKNLSTAISYDSRRFSYEFACEAASVFAANGIKTYIYPHLNPVPLLSWAVRKLSCQAGVMVTASHNPPEYNGYKAYWNDGAQVTPPNDQAIIDTFNSIKDYGTIKWMDFDKAQNEGLIEFIDHKIEDEYYETLLKYCHQPQLTHEKGKELSIVYTPIHGTGLKPCQRILKDMGFSQLYIVEAQSKPDGDFPTVISPNPENPEAMEMALQLMKERKADLAYGTDPDTDRLGVIVAHQNKTYFINGNQIGVLLLHYTLSQHKTNGTMPANPYFINTIVTTPLQEEIATAFDVKPLKTLTGFKWICQKILELEKSHENFVFATEESFGYMIHDQVRDKDAVGTIALFSEMALHYKCQNKTVMDALDEIYNEFGYYCESLLCLSYEGSKGADKIQRIMNHFRENITKDFNQQKIVSIEDYLKNNKQLGTPPSNVLGFHFENGNRLYLRPSGTEPKIKFYIMVQESEGNLDEKKYKAGQLTSKIEQEIKNLCEGL